MSPCRTFLFVVVAVFLACENVYAANVAGLNESKIIGGTVIDISDAPFIVRVVEDRGKLGTKSCGGSAINKFHVLTAAHCVESGPTYLVVYFGVTSRNQLSPQNKCKVKKVHSHPKYKNVGTNGNYRSTWDVSVLLVDKILPDLVTLAPASYKDIPTGKKLTIAGWGQTSKKGEGSTQLRSSIFTAMARSECDKILKGHTDPTDFCVVEDPKHAQCYGDSGGPVYDEDTETQYGIVSWGQCGSNGVGVVTDLTEPAINKFVRAFL